VNGVCGTCHLSGLEYETFRWTLNILINAISARLGGGQTYIRQLLERQPEQDELAVYLLAPPDLVISESKNLIRLDAPTTILKSLWRRTLWEKYKLPKLLKQLQINVLFCPGGSLNGKLPKFCKSVVTFQNMLPFDDKQILKYGFTFPGLRNRLLKHKLTNSMKSADLVIFISEFARQFIFKRCPGKIKASTLIPHGIDPAFRKRADIDTPLPEWLDQQNYFLYVSPFDVYKAQLEVVKAYALLASRLGNIPKLVLVGTHLNAEYSRQVMNLVLELSLEDKVIIKGHVDYAQLPVIYQNALINIFASETENCPFILLEAMAGGRPLVSSNRASMPEFGGESVLYFDPSKPDELAHQLQSLMENDDLRKHMAKLSLAKSMQYDWDLSAEKTWKALVGTVGINDIF
jgi:glycosyltransferase involved in cell wall biosynthesis